MLFYLQLALKNLRRHGKRTLITASAIAVGLAGFLFINSMLIGADQQSELNLIRYETGAIRVYSLEGAAIRSRLSLKSPLEQANQALDALRGSGLSATARISFMADIAVYHPETGDSSAQTIRLQAIDPSTDSQVFPTEGLPMEGKWFGAGEEGIVLGKWLAEDLGAAVGMPLTLATRTRAGSYQVLDLTISGIVESPNPTVNRGTAFLPLALADIQLEMGGTATELVIGLPPGIDTAPAKAKAKAALEASGIKAAVLDWREVATDFMAISSAKSKSSSLIILLVLVIAAVGISNTLLMAFYERKTEIGMLRAIGMDDRALFWLFVLEAGGIGLVGSALGLALGAGLVAWLTGIGIDFGFMIRQMDIGYRISGVFRGVWIPGNFAQALILGILLPMLTAILPTRRALRLPITESLRRE
jgi:ABC-type lipoprotein release transport system permease subunit